MRRTIILRHRFAASRWGSGLAIIVYALGINPLENVALAQGLPEPSLIFYGIVKNTASPGSRRLSYGTLRWTIQEVGGASLPVVITIPLTNINDQFSYVLRIPCETQIGATPISSGKLRLTPAGVQFNRSQVQINGSASATLIAPAATTVTYTSRAIVAGSNGLTCK